MNNFDKVKQLRAVLKRRHIPGYYCWWFHENAANEICQCLGVKDLSHILRNDFDGETYMALYFGISKDMEDRMYWHICQHQHNSFLSTLRLSLCGILTALGKITQNKAEYAVNSFIDANCILEWDYTTTVKEAEIIEKTELSKPDRWYPLNIQGNKSPCTNREAIKRLQELRKTAIRI